MAFDFDNCKLVGPVNDRFGAAGLMIPPKVVDSFTDSLRYLGRMSMRGVSRLMTMCEWNSSNPIRTLLRTCVRKARLWMLAGSVKRGRIVRRTFADALGRTILVTDCSGNASASLRSGVLSGSATSVEARSASYGSTSATDKSILKRAKEGPLHLLAQPRRSLGPFSITSEEDDEGGWMNNVALKIGLCRDLTGDGIAVIPAGVSLIVSLK